MTSLAGIAFSAGISWARCSWRGEWSEMARWHSLSLRKRSSFLGMPTELTVIRLGLQPHPQGAVRISVARSTASRLSIGSPCPMNTMLVSLSVSGRAYIWFRISPAVRFPSNPCLPVWQKRQFILHPTCDETQSVALSPSGIKTVSTKRVEFVATESRPTGKHLAGNRYLMVPSTERWQSMGSIAPTQYSRASRSRFALERLVISSMPLTCR